jgi:hypothetical protein
MDVLVTVANCLFILGYAVKDLLWLRALSFAGATCLAFYFGFRDEPLMHVAYWNVFFAALNAFWVCLLIFRKRVRGQQGVVDG